MDNVPAPPAVEKVSEKVIAAAATAAISPVIAGWLATKVGVVIEVDGIALWLGPIVLFAVTLAAGYLKRDSRVESVLDWVAEILSTPKASAPADPGEPGEPGAIGGPLPPR